MKHASLHIPHDFPEFPEKTLIICVTHREALAYQAEGRTLIERELIATPDTDFQYTDKSSVGSMPGGAGPEPHNKEHYDRVFLNYFVKELQKIIHEQAIKSIYMFIPKELHGLTEKKLPHDIMEKTHLILGNYSHHHPMDLLKKIYEEK